MLPEERQLIQNIANAKENMPFSEGQNLSFNRILRMAPNSNRNTILSILTTPIYISPDIRKKLAETTTPTPETITQLVTHCNKRYQNATEDLLKAELELIKYRLKDFKADVVIVTLGSYQKEYSTLDNPQTYPPYAKDLVNNKKNVVIINLDRLFSGTFHVHNDNLHIFCIQTNFSIANPMKNFLTEQYSNTNIKVIFHSFFVGSRTPLYVSWVQEWFATHQNPTELIVGYFDGELNARLTTTQRLSVEESKLLDTQYWEYIGRSHYYKLDEIGFTLLPTNDKLVANYLPAIKSDLSQQDLINNASNAVSTEKESLSVLLCKSEPDVWAKLFHDSLNKLNIRAPEFLKDGFDWIKNDDIKEKIVYFTTEYSINSTPSLKSEGLRKAASALILNVLIDEKDQYNPKALTYDRKRCLADYFTELVFEIVAMRSSSSVWRRYFVNDERLSELQETISTTSDSNGHPFNDKLERLTFVNLPSSNESELNWDLTTLLNEYYERWRITFYGPLLDSYDKHYLHSEKLVLMTSILQKIQKDTDPKIILRIAEYILSLIYMSTRFDFGMKHSLFSSENLNAIKLLQAFYNEHPSLKSDPTIQRYLLCFDTQMYKKEKSAALLISPDGEAEYKRMREFRKKYDLLKNKTIEKSDEPEILKQRKTVKAIFYFYNLQNNPNIRIPNKQINEIEQGLTTLEQQLNKKIM